jgi:hypothetical protein
MRTAGTSGLLHRLVALAFLSGKVDKIGKIGSSLRSDSWRSVNLRRHLKAEYKVIAIRKRIRRWSGLENTGCGLEFCGENIPRIESCGA